MSMKCISFVEFCSILAEEMLPEYETAKRRCFFDSEQPIVRLKISINSNDFFFSSEKYVTKMIKISRRGYTEHVRMLCITTERVYNLTKRNSYPKEVILFANVLGITCTPYKDGFMCIRTREVNDDRVTSMKLKQKKSSFGLFEG